MLFRQLLIVGLSLFCDCDALAKQIITTFGRVVMILSRENLILQILFLSWIFILKLIEKTVVNFFLMDFIINCITKWDFKIEWLLQQTKLSAFRIFVVRFLYKQKTSKAIGIELALEVIFSFDVFEILLAGYANSMWRI